MLAAMKLGLVVIPATPLLAGADIDDRLARGRARFVIADGADAGKFEGRGEGAERIAVGARARGLARLRRAAATPARISSRTGRRAPTIRCCSISPRARPRGPSSCCTATRATRSAISRRCTASACRPGDVASQHFLARLGQARLVELLRAVERRRDHRRAHRALRAARDARRSRRASRSTSFCAPPTVWRQLIQLDLAAMESRVARSQLGGRAAQPGSDRTGAPRLGSDACAIPTARPRRR